METGSACTQSERTNRAWGKTRVPCCFMLNVRIASGICCSPETSRQHYYHSLTPQEPKQRPPFWCLMACLIGSCLCALCLCESLLSGFLAREQQEKSWAVRWIPKKPQGTAMPQRLQISRQLGPRLNELRLLRRFFLGSLERGHGQSGSECCEVQPLSSAKQ